MGRLRQKGQNIFEFAVCLALVAASISLMAIYVRRSLQARYRAVVLHCVKESGTERQYEPYYTREAHKREKAKGYTATAWNTISGIDMETNATGWEHTPLPERWSSSVK